MGKVLRQIAKYLLILFVAAHLLPLVSIFFNLIGYSIFKHSYVENIVTPSYQERTEYALEAFNEMGDNQIVKHSGWRPIYILEGHIGDHALGVAYSLPLFCFIILERGLPEIMYEQVLWHEYLHCHGYWHTNKEPNDLMAPVYRWTPEENVKWYAQDLKRRVYNE